MHSMPSLSLLSLPAPLPLAIKPSPSPCPLHCPCTIDSSPHPSHSNLMETGFFPRNIFQAEKMPSAPKADAAASANWGIRSFEEDLAGPHVGATWPPRSYACAFCVREFKSAQALGGHMNVHRRDRARLRQPSQASNSCPSTAAAAASFACSNIIFPPPPQRLAAELVASGGGILLLCPLGASAGLVFAQAAAASPTARSGQGEAGAVVEELDLELRLGR